MLLIVVNSDRSGRKTQRAQKQKHVYNSLKRTRMIGMMLGGEFIKEKAKDIAKELNITDHKCSDGWLQGFLRRHDLHYK